jgi:hypothetical protein
MNGTKKLYAMKKGPMDYKMSEVFDGRSGRGDHPASNVG